VLAAASCAMGESVLQLLIDNFAKSGGINPFGNMLIEGSWGCVIVLFLAMRLSGKQVGSLPRFFKTC